MRSALLCAALAAVPVLSLQVTSPSGSLPWVAGLPNVVAWQTSKGDPQFVAITVTHSGNNTFPGSFAIAQDVPVSNLSFTVTNVTLVVTSGYVVNLVNTSNLTQVFASSQPFSLEPNGTTPPNLASITAPGAAATPSSTSPTTAGNSSSSSSNSTSGSSASPSPSKNASSRAVDITSVPILSMLAMTGVMSVFGAIITL